MATPTRPCPYCGAAVLIRGETLPASVGDIVRFTIADEGKAYLIPTR